VVIRRFERRRRKHGSAECGGKKLSETGANGSSADNGSINRWRGGAFRSIP
jgi:hypothetical protein